jgi:hypothetical protein
VVLGGVVLSYGAGFVEASLSEVVWLWCGCGEVVV